VRIVFSNTTDLGLTKIGTQAYLLGNTDILAKDATREGATETEDPPLAKSKLRKKIKYSIVMNFFVSQ